MGLKERLKKEQLRKRSGWPRKRFADGSLWILHPKTEEPTDMIEGPESFRNQVKKDIERQADNEMFEQIENKRNQQ